MFNKLNYFFEHLIIQILSININVGRWIVKFLNLKFKQRNKKELSLYIKAKKNNLDITKLPTVSGVTREIQLGNLVLLKEFDYVCKLNNLNYWLDFGTLLGAVRHKGFIPWDDDIDVSMPRNDYNNIISLFNKSTKNPDIYIEVIRSKRTPCMQYLKILHKKLPFLWVDIFPYDYTQIELNSDNFNNINKNLNNLRQEINNKKELLKYSLDDLNTFIQKEMSSILNNPAVTKKEEITGIVRAIDFPHGQNCWIYDYNDIFPLVDIEFEGYIFKTVNNYQKYLNSIFNNSYMEYPPQIELAHTLKLLISKEEKRLLTKLIEQ